MAWRDPVFYSTVTAMPGESFPSGSSTWMDRRGSEIAGNPSPGGAELAAAAWALTVAAASDKFGAFRISTAVGRDSEYSPVDCAVTRKGKGLYLDDSFLSFLHEADVLIENHCVDHQRHVERYDRHQRGIKLSN
jgi:hypothetical protein